MRVSLKGTNIQLLESTREYVDKKIVRSAEKLLVHDGDALSLEIEVGKTTRHHKTGPYFRAEANLSVGKTMLRAEALGETLNEAIDLVEGELTREIKKFKEKKRTMLLRSARKIKL
ncbi:MAG: ribosome-associated translation inhibitor RaiA [Candidatus Giovannonibacteria bacterium]|nr:MAG: ribosome-associated translation inhibitor RaiA [Candidatus Giovannonibacteria bacterium]